MRARAHLFLAVLYFGLAAANLITAAVGDWPLGLLNVAIAIAMISGCAINLRAWQDKGYR